MINVDKKRKGFTLIELIGVVVVLGLIAIIVTPIINNTIKDNRQKIYEKQINGIIESAKSWGANNISQLPKDGQEPIIVTLGQLKQGGYAKKDLKNPNNSKLFDDEKTTVIISNKNGILTYEVIINE